MIKNHFYLWAASFKKGVLFQSVGVLSMFICMGAYDLHAGEIENDRYLKGDILVQNTITGTVTDETGGPLPGASIVVKGTTNGTQTDFDGNFSIEAASDATLVISYIGYATQEIAVNGQSVVNVNMVEGANQLEEVILVGYGTQSRVSVTNAISSVTSAELVETPTISVAQSLQGRASGVQVTNTGGPGSNPLITIRGLGTFGNGTPLIVVDGIPTGALNSIPTESIESVDVLKDASSTAIYGSRGSNGVILITTKGGKKGKPVFKFSTSAGLANNTKTLDVLNADQYREYAASSYDADPVADGVQIYQGLQPGNFDPNVSTNWQDEIFRTGVWQNYDLEASGGTENATYSVRTGFLEQEGTLLNSDFKRYSLGVNTSVNVTDKFTIGQTLNIGLSDNNNIQQAGSGSVLVNALRMTPTVPVFDSATNFFSEITTNFDGQDAENPVRILSNGSALTQTTSILGSLFASYEIFEGLTYRFTLGVDHSNSNFNGFNKSIPTGSRQRLFSETRKNRNRFLGTVLTNTLNYKKTINNLHGIDILAGYERNKANFETVQTFTQNTLTDVIEELNPGDVRNVSSFSNENILQSVFGRISYDYDKTFLISATMRADGSSRFGANNRWGYFPSVSGGVNLANLGFLSENETISTLKLRGSWGLTGNQNIGDYLFAAGIRTDISYVIDGGLVSGTIPSRTPNPDLKWEELSTVNIGADIGLFNNALTIAAEYYVNKSDGLLVAVPVIGSDGSIQNSETKNVGGTETKGFDLTLGYNKSNGDFNWGVNFNLGAYSSEVTSLGATEAVFNGNYFQQNHNRLFVGEPLLHFFGFKTDGIFQNDAEVSAHATQNAAAPGNIRYADLNGDGEINGDDRTIIGNPNPDLTANLDFNFSYKGFDASIFLNGVYGNDIYNGNRYNLEQQARLFNVSTDILNRWSPSNPSATIPAATPGFTGNEDVSDRFVEDGSFTRLRSVTLGYTFKENVLEKLINAPISKVRIYLTGQNLATFTDYSGYDPEVVPITTGGTVTALGLDQGNYPQPRTIIAGLQVQF